MRIRIAAVLAFVVACGYPTAPSSTPREMVMEAYVEERCAQLGFPGIATVFTDYVYMTSTTVDGRKVSVPAFAWAKPGGDHVTVWRAAVNDATKYPNDVLDAYARHECCHIAGNWSEEGAAECERTRYGGAGHSPTTGRSVARCAGTRVRLPPPPPLVPE